MIPRSLNPFVLLWLLTANTAASAQCIFPTYVYVEVGVHVEEGSSRVSAPGYAQVRDAVNNNCLYEIRATLKIRQDSPGST